MVFFFLFFFTFAKVVALLDKRAKRLFKGRDLVDALTDMCVDGAHIINNNVSICLSPI